jgi:hypothetical protein
MVDDVMNYPIINTYHVIRMKLTWNGYEEVDTLPVGQ